MPNRFNKKTTAGKICGSCKLASHSVSHDTLTRQPIQLINYDDYNIIDDNNEELVFLNTHKGVYIGTLSIDIRVDNIGNYKFRIFNLGGYIEEKEFLNHPVGYINTTIAVTFRITAGLTMYMDCYQDSGSTQIFAVGNSTCKFTFAKVGEL